MRNKETNEIVLRGLYYCVWQFFGWSQAEEVFEAIDKIAAFKTDGVLALTKAQYLLEFAHYLIEKNSFLPAQNILKLAERAVAEIADDFFEAEVWLSLQREILVSYVYNKKWIKAEKTLDRVYKTVDWRNEKQVELYAYSCYSAARLCQEMMEWNHMLRFADALQDMAEMYGSGERDISFNDKIHYYYLHTKLMRVETVSISTQLLGMGEYGLQITDELIMEIEHNDMIADFAGLLVGARALKVGYDEQLTDDTVRQYLDETDELLERYPDRALLAEKAMDLWETAYTLQFKKKVSREMVEKAYVLALRFHQNREVLNQFLSC